MKHFLVAISLAFSCIAQAQDSARQLAQILAEKGILTNDELGNIERAGADDAVRLLSAALYERGILTQSEMARVSGPAAGVPGEARFVPVVATAAVPASPAQSANAQSTATVQTPEVTSASHFPIQIYGTVLWNSFYNTGGNQRGRYSTGGLQNRNRPQRKFRNDGSPVPLRSPL